MVDFRVITLYNVCVVPWGGGLCSTVGDIMMHVGDILSTVGDVQYHRGYDDDRCGDMMMIDVGDTLSTVGGHH